MVTKRNKLKKVVADYAKAFPDWRLVGSDTLLRVTMGIGQSIWFDSLRTDEYRPTIRHHVFCALSDYGGTTVLTRVLDIKWRQISFATHLSKYEEVCNRLKSDIAGSALRDLNSNQLVQELKTSARGHVAQSYALSCLLASLGEYSESLEWADEYKRSFSAMELEPDACDVLRADFLERVANWIQSGCAKTELSNIAAAELEKFCSF